MPTNDDYYVVETDERSPSVRVYLLAVLQGLFGVTLRHFLRNLFGGKQDMPTISYPEERRPIPEGYRGKHVLYRRADAPDKPRCVACFMCATACPARCITIEAGEYQDGDRIEKYPVRFEIDGLRCIYCGMCEEACPKDAIALTSFYETAAYTRKDCYWTKEDLLESIESMRRRS
ncbi:MAG: hypothetical protein A2284_13685 [Deltaproteobacteria bacterium RIFOXYA12_FULL_61_11]|nr:MAG: hypothetical protein A2284_13685 [Deltaproteobacteria bacterium RIFOXYA12_FULL_61_11]